MDQAHERRGAGMEFAEYPLFNLPSLMLTMLRAAAMGPVSLDDCLATLRANVAKAHEHPDVGDGDILLHLAKARQHLTAAGLLRDITSERFAITTRGREVLRDHPTGVDDSVLEQFAEFRAWLAASARQRLANVEEVPEGAGEKRYDEGYEAYFAGRTQRENPYDFETVEHMLWDCGWFEGLDEDRARERPRRSAASTSSRSRR